MSLTEIPTDRLIDWGGWWLPYAMRVAAREGWAVADMLSEALAGEARVFVIWGRDGAPSGACATRLLLRNDKTPIGELHWWAGEGMCEWLPTCLPLLEKILVRDHGVVAIKTTGRPGLKRAFAPYGFRCRKVILEKVIAENAR